MLRRVFASEEGQFKAWLTGAIIALGAVVGGYFVYAAWVKRDRPFQTTLMCSMPGCGCVRSESPQVGEMMPAKCPRCGKPTLVPAFHCPHCGTVNIWNESRGLPPPTKCHGCGREVRHG